MREAEDTDHSRCMMMVVVVVVVDDVDGVVDGVVVQFSSGWLVCWLWKVSGRE